MDFIKSVWDFLTSAGNLYYVETGLAILGGLKVFSKLTKTTVDDKILDAIMWPLTKLYEVFKSKPSA